MNPNASLYYNTNSSASTLRPRTHRLISFIDDENDESAATSSSAATQSSKATPLFPSRGTSPNYGIARTRSLKKSESGAPGRAHTRATSEGAPAAGNTDLWTSWSSIASSLLGSEGMPGTKGKGKAVSKPPKWMKQDCSDTPGPVTPKWGLSSRDMPTTIAGSTEDRQSLLQAERRKALLLANAEKPNGLGRHKRRDSDANSAYAENEEDAPVYMHKIRKNDTLAGVMLKYGCQPDVFRKVNRLWPNDIIQTRTHVFLPVDACSVRGKKVDSPQNGHDLLGGALDELDRYKGRSSSSPNGIDQKVPKQEAPVSPTMSPLSLTVSNADEGTLKHDSWVVLSNFTEPTEILRMPRRSLGYFPRAKRKSSATLAEASTTSTPKSSFDMLRHPPTHAAQVSMSLNASPVRRPGSHLRRDSGRQRSSSTTTTTTTTTQASFTDALRGPGGVGTLRGLRTEPSRPGPADDSLNRKFAQYFPDLALAPPADVPIARLGTPQRATPRASIDSVRSHRSNSSGLGDVGGALEGWVRKLAGNKKDKLGPAKMGDLIELETNSELGEPIIDDDFPTPTAASMKTQEEGESNAAEEALLNERFPIRGRVKTAYSGGKDKGD